LERVLFINTLLQRGVLRRPKTQNRFNAVSKTAEAVKTAPPASYTPLKQGVNEKIRSDNHRV
jgi:hypothetical protein